MRWIVLIAFAAVLAAHLPAAAGKTPLDAILDGIEKRYAGSGFSADFFQESTLKAMQITDTAQGRLFVKRPRKMRWEYSIPDEQIIITDGQSLWIHRPADNQVMVGEAPAFFGQGKGAAFLSDIRLIRESFDVTLRPAENDTYHRLRLVPLEPVSELSEVILSVDKQSYRVDQVITYNAYQDETRIVLSNYQFNLDLDDSLFTFDIPDNADVVQIANP